MTTASLRARWAASGTADWAPHILSVGGYGLLRASLAAWARRHGGVPATAPGRSGVAAEIASAAQASTAVALLAVGRWSDG